ncbi:hypothetical protein Tco_0596781 [Tanacetum coccineum]
MLSVKKANRGSCGLGEVGSPGQGHPPKQPAERESKKEQREGHKCDKIRRVLVASDVRQIHVRKFASETQYKSVKTKKLQGLLVGFSGETYHPLGIIDLRVTMGKAGRSKTVLMEFDKRTSNAENKKHLRPRALSRFDAARKNMGQGIGRGNAHHFTRPSEPAHNDQEKLPYHDFVMEHPLKYTLCRAGRPKRRQWTTDGKTGIERRGVSLAEGRTIRRVQHLGWVANTVPVKLTDGT